MQDQRRQRIARQGYENNEKIQIKKMKRRRITRAVFGVPPELTLLLQASAHLCTWMADWDLAGDEHG